MGQDSGMLVQGGGRGEMVEGIDRGMYCFRHMFVS
jgi:hypothetical protein